MSKLGLHHRWNYMLGEFYSIITWIFQSPGSVLSIRWKVKVSGIIMSRLLPAGFTNTDTSPNFSNDPLLTMGAENSHSSNTCRFRGKTIRITSNHKGCFYPRYHAACERIAIRSLLKLPSKIVPRRRLLCCCFPLLGTGVCGDSW